METTIERLKTKSESEPVVEAPQRKSKADLVVLSKSVMARLILNSNDDNVENVAKHFAAEHGLEDDAIPALVAYIEDIKSAPIEETLDMMKRISSESIPSQKNSKRPNRKAPKTPTKCY